MLICQAYPYSEIRYSIILLKKEEEETRWKVTKIIHTPSQKISTDEKWSENRNGDKANIQFNANYNTMINKRIEARDSIEFQTRNDSFCHLMIGLIIDVVRVVLTYLAPSEIYQFSWLSTNGSKSLGMPKNWKQKASW